MQPVVVETVPQVVLASDQHAGTRQGYNGTLSKGLGVAQITIGATCILLQFIAIGVQAGVYQVGHGIWCGIFFIIAGTFGVAAGGNKRTGYIITTMILSILSVVIFMAPLISCSAIGLSIDNRPKYRYSGPPFYQYIETDDGKNETRKWMNGLMIGLALLEGIIAIISSTITCGPLCCPGAVGTTHSQGQVIHNQATGQRMIVVGAPSGGYPQYLLPAGAPQNFGQPAPYAIQPGMQTYPQVPVNMNPPPYYAQTGSYPQMAATNAGLAQVHTACTVQPSGGPQGYQPQTPGPSTNENLPANKE